MKIRKVTLDDTPAICNIINYYIENSAIILETVPYSEIGAKQRINDIINSGHLFYVGEVAGRVIGFYHTKPWESSFAYAAAVEESIFLDKDERGKGYGTQLFEHLLKHIDRATTHTLIATLVFPNESSVRLHEKFGFTQISRMKEIGRKFDQWIDVGHWQLILK
jgi:phosphinothricin acetyltransferase